MLCCVRQLCTVVFVGLVLGRLFDIVNLGLCFIFCVAYFVFAALFLVLDFVFSSVLAK